MLPRDSMLQRLGADAIMTDHHMVDWQKTNDGIRTRFLDKTGGIHSAAQAQLFPSEGPPIWNGAILWRGTTMAPPFLTGRSMIMPAMSFNNSSAIRSSTPNPGPISAETPIRY